MIKRFILAGTALAIATFGLTAVPAHAGQYPPNFSVTTKVEDNKATISADVCEAGQGLEVTFTITPSSGPNVVLKATADQNGHAEVTYTITQNGVYHVVVTLPNAECDPSDDSFQSISPLPQTGSDSAQWVVTATALVATGAGFALVAMRRRRHAAA